MLHNRTRVDLRHGKRDVTDTTSAVTIVTCRDVPPKLCHAVVLGLPSTLRTVIDIIERGNDLKKLIHHNNALEKTIVNLPA